MSENDAEKKRMSEIEAEKNGSKPFKSPVTFSMIIIGLLLALLIPLVAKHRKLQESNAALSKSYLEAKAEVKKTDNDCRERIRELDSKWTEAYNSLPERLHARAKSTRFGRR